VTIKQNNELYIDCIDKWSKLANLATWSKWATNLMKSPKAEISSYLIADFYELHGWMFAMEYRWPNHCLEFQAAFQNFRQMLEPLLMLIADEFYLSKGDRIHFLEKSEFLTHHPNETLEEYIRISNHNYPGEALEEYVVELTKAGNHIQDLIEQHFSSNWKESFDCLNTKDSSEKDTLSDCTYWMYTIEEKEQVYSYWFSIEQEEALQRRDFSFFESNYETSIHYSSMLRLKNK